MENVDLEFEALLRDKQHSEIITALEQIASYLSKIDNKSVAQSISVQTQRIEQLLSSESLSMVNNTKDFVSLLQKMSKEITESNNRLIQTIEERMLPSSFTLVKHMGVTQSVKVEYKPANELNT